MPNTASMRARSIALTGLLLAVLFAGQGARGEQLALGAPTEHAGTADWVRFGVVRYHLEFVEQRPATVTAGSTGVAFSRSLEGEVLAYLELCSDQTLSDCERGQTWTGELGSELTGGGGIEADPALTVVRFSGWLRDVGSGSPCEFEVTWTAAGAPILTPDYAAGQDGASAQARLTRGAITSVDASCWGTASGDPAFDAGSGSVAGTVAASAAA